MQKYVYIDVRGQFCGPFEFTQTQIAGRIPEKWIEYWNHQGVSNRLFALYEEKPKLMSRDGRFKYGESEILDEMREYIASTYGEHYATGVKSVQTFDAIIEMDKGEAWRFFRNCAIKYLWRLGRKDGFNKKDLFKAMHYLVLLFAQIKDKN